MFAHSKEEPKFLEGRTNIALVHISAPRKSLGRKRGHFLMRDCRGDREGSVCVAGRQQCSVTGAVDSNLKTMQRATEQMKSL